MKRPAGLARAHDPPLFEVEQMPMVVGDRRAADVAALLRAGQGHARDPSGARARTGARERPHPRQRLRPAAGGRHRVEALAHTATRTPPSASSGTGVSWSGSPPAARPARRRSNSTSQRGQRSMPASSSPSCSALPARGACVPVRQQRARDVGEQQRRAVDGEHPEPAGLEPVGVPQREPSWWLLAAPGAACPNAPPAARSHRSGSRPPAPRRPALRARRGRGSARPAPA